MFYIIKTGKYPQTLSGFLSSLVPMKTRCQWPKDDTLSNLLKLHKEESLFPVCILLFMYSWSPSMVMHVGNQFRRLRQEDLEVDGNLSYVAKLSQNTYHKNILKDLSGPTCNIQSPFLRQ